MKKSRFRWRITLWFSLALLMMCLLMGGAVISLYRVKIENDVLDQLQLTVDQCAETIGKEPELQAVLRGSEAKEIESSVFLQDSVFLTIYHEDQTRACGLFLYGEDKEIPLHDGQIRRLKAEGSRCCLYDCYIELEEGGLWVRGLAYSGTDTGYLFSGLRDIFLVFPLILTAALLGGYWLAGRFLEPVSRISRTAENIRKSGDLTRRVESGNTGDELSALAESFNAMFDRLEKNFEAERQFTSNASHELRTPVTVILAQCEYALTNTAADREELKEALQVVQRQGSYRNPSAPDQNRAEYWGLSNGGDRCQRSDPGYLPGRRYVSGAGHHTGNRDQGRNMDEGQSPAVPYDAGQSSEKCIPLRQRERKNTGFFDRRERNRPAESKGQRDGDRGKGSSPYLGAFLPGRRFPEEKRNGTGAFYGMADRTVS